MSFSSKKQHCFLSARGCFEGRKQAAGGVGSCTTFTWVRKSPAVLKAGWQEVEDGWGTGGGGCSRDNPPSVEERFHSMQSKGFGSISLLKQWHQGPHVSRRKQSVHTRGSSWGNRGHIKSEALCLCCMDGLCRVVLLRKSRDPKCWSWTKGWPSFLAPFGSFVFFTWMKKWRIFLRMSELRWRTLTASFSTAQEIIWKSYKKSHSYHKT